MKTKGGARSNSPLEGYWETCLYYKYEFASVQLYSTSSTI